MTDRPPPDQIASTLRQIAHEKREHVKKWQKDRPAHWIEHYANQIEALDWAAVGYENLAKRNAEHG